MRKKVFERYVFYLNLYVYVLFVIKCINKKIILYVFKGIYFGIIFLLYVVLIFKSWFLYIELLNLKLIFKELFYVFMIFFISLVLWYNYVFFFGFM